jgi:acetyl esterase
VSEKAQVLSYGKKLENAGLGPNKMATIESSRDMLRQVTKVMSKPNEKLAKTTEKKIEGPRGPITIRVYQPKSKSAKTSETPLIIFTHGGGWVVGDLNLSHEALLVLSDLTGGVIVSADYRLAPENKFPAGLEDVYAATTWAVKNAKELGANPKKLVMIGESAGANLTAATTLLAKKKKGPKIAFQILIYPPLDLAREQSKYVDTEVGKMTMAAKEMIWMRDNYLEADKLDEVTNPLVSPLFGDLKGLPPAIIFTAENDPLTDQDREYAKKLNKAGVKAKWIDYPDAIHGFWNFPSHFASGNDAVHKAARAIKKL